MISIAVVAHVKRETMANQLASDVEADFPPFFDDGTLGVNGNHTRVWQHLANTNSDWAICLEDDAIPTPGFRTQAAAALTATPTDVVSFYLGTGRPVWMELAGRGSAKKLQPLIREAVQTATSTGACFITAPKLFHAVAVAIRTPLIPSMLTHVKNSPQAIDFAIGDWCTTQGHTVAYTVPSLCDHHDTETVITRHHDGQPRLHPRKAHHFGTRDTWNSKTVEL